MKTQVVFGVLLSMLFFGGCLGSFSAVPNLEEKSGSNISIKNKNSVENGRVILKTYDYIQIKGIKITEDINETFIFGKVIFKNGDFLKEYIDTESQEKFYCGKNYQPIGASEPSSIVCLIEEFDEIDGFLTLFNSKDSDKSYSLGPFSLNNILSYERVVEEDNSQSFKKVELVFDGVQRGMLLLTYREYLDSPRRPSYSSQMIYNLNRSKSTDITYKSAKIRVYKATKNKIVYKIIKPLEFD